jgi:hypothetical protein
MYGYLAMYVVWFFPYALALILAILYSLRKRPSNVRLLAISVSLSVFLTPLPTEICMINCKDVVLPSGFLFTAFLAVLFTGDEVGEVPLHFVLIPAITCLLHFLVLRFAKKHSR